MLANLYSQGLGLLTDLYQLSMAQGYWKNGMERDEAVFHLYFRKNPFKGGYTVSAGQGIVHEFLEDFGFRDDDIAYLRSMEGSDGQALFDPAFLEYLAALKLTADVDAVAEGTLVFPFEPMLRVRGPVIECQLLESALLNILNFSSLIATKAARVSWAAKGAPVVEFGLRRAQGIDGALTASRAAHIGGCSVTSNVLAGKLYGVPVKGTHAHSWVMCFENELDAFLAYANAMPNNSVLLVDTYDTLEGVANAVRAGRHLRERGHELAGIRLDSGDLAWLSIEARRILDAGGFPAAKIVASNDLDERLIQSLIAQGARIDIWGVGTNLVTGQDQPALGGVYKLAAIRKPGGEWRHRVKLSEQAVKTSVPGIQNVRRFRGENGLIGDAIYDSLAPLPKSWTIVDPADPLRRKHIPNRTQWEDLLKPFLRNGQAAGPAEGIDAARERAQGGLASLHEGTLRFDNPHSYPAGFELGLHEHRTRLVLERREALAAAERTGT